MALNLLYSLGFKKIPIVDVSIISAGFILRFLFGAAIIGSMNTVWFFLIILAVSFYMSFGKRRNEMSGENNKAFYSRDFLDKNMYVCQTLSVMFYTLWCIDPLTASRLGNPPLIYTVPVLLLILFRYSFNIEKNASGDPTTVLLNDKALIALCALFVLSLLILIHYRSFL
jgi:4-hydroxybenzoate polyprenyltransferase